MNLPAPLSSFVGREREKGEVHRLLRSTRLLTLTGPGGCGKTRLAIEAARDFPNLPGEYSDGVWLAELAPVSEADLVPQAIAEALGISDAAGRSATGTLVAYLKSRKLLLIVDNCEHLIDTAARLVQSLLSACPGLRVLATGREPLHIPGEVTWLVPSLSLPSRERPLSTDELLHSEAARLFVERAAANLPSFELTAANAPALLEVCHKLDGIPLALELAAARVKVLTLEELASRLDDSLRLLAAGSRTGLTRQQTLKAALDWSYDLLSSPEQALFRRLSVFAGGFDLPAAEAVCSDGVIENAEVLELLAQLVDKSLVTVRAQGSQARYNLLEPVRHNTHGTSCKPPGRPCRCAAATWNGISTSPSAPSTKCGRAS